MKIIDFPQGSLEWLQSRAGKVTASCIVNVLAKIKSGEAAARRDYKAQLVAEILTGQPQGDTYINAEMQFGLDTEPFARAAYEAQEGVLVEQVGLVVHPRIERGAASPDGLVDDSGLVEIKCPKVATHLTYLLDGTVPSKYQSQMLWQMACCERDWCDFVSFRPDLPTELQLFKVRFNRDDTRITAMEVEVIVFLSEVDELLTKLNARKAA
ncbi:MAG: YqaJ viral recombinase family protein [Gallionella sp.]|nr:YqaJ viral recombinase family protein [Gallionella sp.]